MTAVSAIRDGLATRLQTISGVRTFDEVPEPGVVTGNATGAVIQYAGTDYDSSMGRGSDEMTFTVVMLTPFTADRAAKDRIDGYLDTAGSTSVKAAVDGNLGGAVTDACVTSASGYQTYSINDVPTYLGVEFTVAVML